MSETEICIYCKKPAIRFEQTLSRWFDNSGEDCVAHFDCERKAENKPPVSAHEAEAALNEMVFRFGSGLTPDGRDDLNTETIRGFIEETRKDREVDNLLGELLAVIFRDGGQYRIKNGTMNAVKEAILVVLRDREIPTKPEKENDMTFGEEPRDDLEPIHIDEDINPFDAPLWSDDKTPNDIIQAVLTSKMTINEAINNLYADIQIKKLAAFESGIINFSGYLIDNEEGEVVTEESVLDWANEVSQRHRSTINK